LKNLIKDVIHHTGHSRLVSIATVFNGEDLIQEMTKIGEILESDLGVLDNALEEILKIAKRKNYEKIREIIEDKEYEYGHYF
jgi:hypothetical protein